MTEHEFSTKSRTFRERWWPRLRSIFRAGVLPERECPGLLDIDSFSRALHREWSRSQRLGLPLSMVLISGSSPSASIPPLEQELKAFARELLNRMRCTDILGWHRPGKLGVILAHTPGEAAWDAVMADIKARLALMPSLSKSVTVEVFTSSDTSNNDYAVL